MSLVRDGVAREAARRASELRQRLGIGRDIAVCPIDSAIAAGIDVWLMALPSAEGAYSRDRGPAIVLSTERPPPRQSFTCAHEMGHHEFGHGTRSDQYLDGSRPYTQFDKDEFTADAFASHFLMPPAAVRTAFRSHGCTPLTGTSLQYLSIANWLGVGYETLIRHLQISLKLIPTTTADVLRKSSPKLIRDRLLGDSQTKHLVIVTPAWVARSIDLRVGDTVLLPRGTEQEGSKLRIESEGPNGLLATGVCPGIGRVESLDSGWNNFIRVMPRDFEGLARFRFQEEYSDANIIAGGT
jgi:Zn-dependent peptidase ImmA (M78 family)